MGELLVDLIIATAILGRLLHHSHLLNIVARATGSGKNAERGSLAVSSQHPRQGR